MLIERNRCVITIRENQESEDYACVGVSRNYYRIGDEMIDSPVSRKPHADFSIGDLERMYDDFLRQKRTRLTRSGR